MFFIVIKEVYLKFRIIIVLNEDKTIVNIIFDLQNINVFIILLTLILADRSQILNPYDSSK